MQFKRPSHVPVIPVLRGLKKEGREKGEERRWEGRGGERRTEEGGERRKQAVQQLQWSGI